MSSPWLPSTKSSPGPPTKSSLPLPPSSVSFPGPPSIAIDSSVKVPFAWSTRTRSFPPPALTPIAVNRLRSKEASAVPLSPTSTSSTVGTPAWSRSASLSLDPLPVT